MSVCTFASAGHSPGQTAAALALAMHWPRPVFIVEADASTTSSVLAGRMRGQLPHTGGLLAILGASGPQRIPAEALWRHSVEIAPHKRLVPGFSSLGAARGAGAFWEHFMDMLAVQIDAETDVLIDAGRLPARVIDNPLLARADLLLLATGATLPDIAALLAPVTPDTTVLDECKEALAPDQADRLRLLTIERARDNYADHEITAATGTPCIGRIPWLPGAAARYSHGAQDAPRRERERHRAAIIAITRRIDQALSGRRALLRRPAEPSPTAPGARGAVA